MRRLLTLFVAGFVLTIPLSGRQDVRPARADGSLRFAVIGDNGTGKSPQYDVAARLALARGGFPFEFVIMVGDNLYGRQRPQDLIDKFDRPYAPILKAGVPFYAALGNHDDPGTRTYPGFNMGGQRYYTYVKRNVRFIVLDSNLMDAAQVAWFDRVLSTASEEWRICYFHHPLYSDGGRHGSNVELRVLLEPKLVSGGIDAVFSGHEHFYARTKPQRGITHFIEGSSGQLRKGDVRPTALTAAYFDTDYTFMLVEIAGDEMSFQTVSRTGRIVDSGAVARRPKN